MAGFNDYIRSAGETAAAHFGALQSHVASQGGAKGVAEQAAHHARESTRGLATTGGRLASDAYGAFRTAGGIKGHLDRFAQYSDSDAGRATLKHAAGTSFSRFLDARAKRSFRRGGYITGALFTFAHQAFQGHMARLKADQRIFTNVARVRRGEPEVRHMTHQELREVADHAHRYGGQHAEHVLKAANDELNHRATRRVDERTRAYKLQSEQLHEVRRAHSAQDHATRVQREQQAHERKLKQRGELHAQEMSHEERRLKMRQALGMATKPPKPPKTPKPPKAAQTAAPKKNTAVAPQKPQSTKQYTVIGHTQAGGEIRRSRGGNTYTVGAGKLKGLKSKSAPKARTR